MLQQNDTSSEVLMKSKGLLTIALGVFGALAALSQAPAQGQRQGPGVQAPQDSRYQALIATCKNPPPPRGGGPGQPAAPAQGAQARGAAPAQGAPPAAQQGPREYKVTEIPGVIAAGQQWKTIWQASGNVADGIVGSNDGGLLIAQNDKSDVLKLDKDGKESVAYMDTNTGGSVSINSKGAVFIVQRGLNQAVWQLAPQRKMLANKYQDDPLDCIGGVINDLTADSKGGVYFTMGGLFYASPSGVVTRYGENLRTNGVILSPDEKTVYVTNGPTLAAFDVQPDGSLKNQREFVKFEGNGDGSTVDSAGRIYVTSNTPGIQVIGSDGKYLGLIPTPRNVISTAFSGPDKKTLYAVISYGPRESLQAEIIGIPMIAQGYKGRPK
jgi:sugar lactone lactonase YvrE